jgi:hypothetical protein
VLAVRHQRLLKARMEVALVGRVVDSVLVGPARARMDLNGLDYISAVACVRECQIYMAVSVEAETRMYQNAKLLGKLPSPFLLVRVAPFVIPFPLLPSPRSYLGSSHVSIHASSVRRRSTLDNRATGGRVRSSAFASRRVCPRAPCMRGATDGTDWTRPAGRGRGDHSSFVHRSPGKGRKVAATKAAAALL